MVSNLNQHLDHLAFVQQAWIFQLRIVLESLVRSGYLPPNGSNRDWDQLVFSQKPNLTGPNRYKPVIVS